PKIVKKCTYPLTGLECVDTVITDLAVVDVSPEGLVLREVAPGWRPQDVQKLTGAPLMTKGRLPEIRLPRVLHGRPWEEAMSAVIPEKYAGLIAQQASGNPRTLPKDGRR